MTVRPCPTESTVWWPAEDVPCVTVSQMRHVDDLMVHAVGVGLASMMENAGRSLAELAVTRFAPASVTVLVGVGNNGGGGLVAARHLVNRGLEVAVVTSGRSPRGGLVDAQLRAAEASGVSRAEDPPAADLIIDAMVGYGLAGSLRGRVAELARWANEQPAPTLSLDGPSGLDFDTGANAFPTVTATATLTLALPKPGLVAATTVGELYVADISVPARVYAEIGISPPFLFESAPIVGIRRPGELDATCTPGPVSALTWSSWTDAARLVVTGATFPTASRISLVVGTVLTVVNQSDAMTQGDTGPDLVLRVVANYVVPYLVSSFGMLSATRAPGRSRRSATPRKEPP